MIGSLQFCRLFYFIKYLKKVLKKFEILKGKVYLCITKHKRYDTIKHNNRK